MFDFHSDFVLVESPYEYNPGNINSFNDSAQIFENLRLLNEWCIASSIPIYHKSGGFEHISECLPDAIPFNEKVLKGIRKSEIEILLLGGKLTENPLIKYELFHKGAISASGRQYIEKEFSPNGNYTFISDCVSSTAGLLYAKIIGMGKEPKIFIPPGLCVKGSYFESNSIYRVADLAFPPAKLPIWTLVEKI